MTLVHKYLILYNAVSAALWAYVLVSAGLDTRGYFTEDQSTLYGKPAALAVMEALLTPNPPHHFLLALQLSNAILETVHTVLRIVPLPLTTVVLQFAARLFITHGISLNLPFAPGNFHPAYIGLTTSWAITEVVRYGYYTSKLVHGHVPHWFTWLRYSLFVVLYPVGLVCEATVVYVSLVAASGSYKNFLMFGLAMYIPGFLTLYSYMWRQRSKVLGTRKVKQKTE